MGLFDIAQELLGGGQTSGAGDMVSTVMHVLNGHQEDWTAFFSRFNRAV
jgi:hypothetical protein